MTISGNFERFWKLEYCLLVKSTKFEYKTFPYKTALSESSVKVNRNGEYKMDLSQRTEFYQTNLFTWKVCFSLRASYKRVDLIKDVKELSLAKLSNILDLMYQLLKCPYTAWKVSKYGFFSGPYFLVLALNMEIYIVFSPNAGKHGPEKTPYLNTFHAVIFILFVSIGVLFEQTRN